MSAVIIQGPPQVLGVPSPQAYLGRLVDALAHRSLTAWKAGDRLRAYVNHGRWLVDCPCGESCSTSPAWGMACCLGCGAIFEAIEFPPARMRQDIEHLFEPRTMAQRNWYWRESVEQLAAENIAHGLRV